jgi:predicted ribosomally synthesized peptide with nif11-like leader
MIEKQLKAVLDRLNEDKDLQAKIKIAIDVDSANAILKEAGFDVNVAELMQHRSKVTNEELSDVELEMVSGGGCYGFIGSMAEGNTVSGIPCCR